MMEKIRVAAVSYLNTQPFLYGLKKSKIYDMIDLSLDIPSECARKLLADEVDIALVPITVIPKMKEYYLVSDYCIGADKPVKSVKLFSEVPIEKVENVYLDYQSRTSNLLVQILMQFWWKKEVTFIHGKENYEKNISGNTAGIIIGDRALAMASKFKYEYDLAEEWINLTKMPFVFASWISNKKIPSNIQKNFNEALTFGVKHKEEAVQEAVKDFNGNFDLNDYLMNCIDYHLDENKKKSMKLFFQYKRELNWDVILEKESN